MATTFTVDRDLKKVGEREGWGRDTRYKPYERFTGLSTEQMFQAKLGKVGRSQARPGSSDWVLITPPIEGVSERTLIGPSSGLHPLIECLGAAYDKHLPVVLSPDVMWACISQALAQFIKGNAESLRSNFVEHEGQEYIEIQRDDFIKGSRENDWAGCFDEFSTKIKGYIGKQHSLFAADFATTGPVEKAVSEIVLMDAMSEYFSYGVRTCCGFPRFTLLGDVCDWESIRDRVKKVRELKPKEAIPTLAEWLDVLDPICDELVKAAQGKEDKDFWGQFFKNNAIGSGGPTISGWVNVLFPLNSKGQLKGAATNWNKGMSVHEFPHPNDFTDGLSTVDVKWFYYAQEFDLKFAGGLIGVSESEDNELKPEFGWCVYDATADKVEVEAPRRW